MNSDSAPRYFPLLDSLRALAVAGVLLTHFSPTFAARINGGSLGIQLFFVLSGFLITGLLLDARRRVEEGRTTRRREWRNFLVRRTLRIFPLYYGVLGLGLFLNLDHVRAAAGWLLAYGYNFRIWLAGGWPDRLLSHFWSLAVEEQFYLLWPWLVLLAPRRSLPWIMAALIPTALGFRIACHAGVLGSPVGQVVLLPSCWDLLAAGGLLAWARHTGWTESPSARRLLPAVLLVGLAGLLLGASFAPADLPHSWFGPFAGTLDAAFFTVLIHLCALNRIGWLRWLLDRPALIYLGRISYGLYVLHNFMHYAGPGISGRLFGLRYFPREWEHVLWLSACTFVAAALSYHFYERPCQGLSRRWSPLPGAGVPFHREGAGWRPSA